MMRVKESDGNREQERNIQYAELIFLRTAKKSSSADDGSNDDFMDFDVNDI